jgi:hypothetical protein
MTGLIGGYTVTEKSMAGKHQHSGTEGMGNTRDIQDTFNAAPGAHFFAFNGDADGLCALQQLRLAEASQPQAVLVTGVKRDIRLLQRIEAGHGDRVTVLDVSHEQNVGCVRRLLDGGAQVRYFDHHFAGDLEPHPRFDAHINTAPDVCTSSLVNGYLGGRHVRWAIVAAFGDELPQLGEALARLQGLTPQTVASYAQLGRHLNYNAYGECVGDLHFDPAALAEAMLPFADPADFMRETSVLAALCEGYREDMDKARALCPEGALNGATLVTLPPEAWARRATGVLANELMQTRPDHALAVLTPKSDGGFVVSVRVPAGRPLGADDFCRSFETGGGRKRAGGINHLPETEVERFVERFETAFGTL